MLRADVHIFIIKCFVLTTLMFPTVLRSARSESSFVSSFFRSCCHSFVLSLRRHVFIRF